ncbi:MAG TPA: hypothetical protein VNO50_03925 [Pyrinomonadaceae bacterium]|nr:hypothetical protein [Pyrinomonadaceae bacterium]
MKYELKVNRKELIDGLNLLRKTAKPKKNMEAVLTFEDGNFVVFVNGVSIEATAQGAFPGMVRIPAAQAITLAKVLPPEDPLTIAYEETRLYIGTFSMPCVWHNVEPNPIQLPINPPFTVLLGLPLKYSDQEIFQSGLSKPLDEAQRRRKLLTTKAVNLLLEFGVSRAEVEKLIEESIKRLNLK